VRLSLALAALLAALVAAPAHAATIKRPPVSWLKGEGNYTKAHRGPQAIRCIVIHVTEGPFWPSIRWLRGDRSHASSHYIVSRRGRIVQLVHQSDIAWHAGNRRINRESIGIEIAGFVGDPAGFTDAQYRSAARLAAYVARRSLIPIDRRHFIGHADVPNPFVPGGSGGSDGHTDPGRYWSWNRYLRLVRKYAYPPKPVRLRVESGTLFDGQRVKGVVPWRARVKGPVRRVEVRVDGRLVLRDRRAPFGGRWDTRRVRNGRHLVELRAYGPRGAWTRKRISVRVRNVPLVVSAGVAREVTGVVRLRARVAGGRPRIVLLFVDGRRVDHDTSVPFAFGWDSRRFANGSHALELRVRSRDGRTASRKFQVLVANPVIVSQSIVDGQWRVETTGRVERVEFLVDGVVRATVTAAPFVWTWDAAAEPGPHTLAARAIAPDGTFAEAST
jgi:N-acetyl-anhydromuramyl-L-alanine amidase AmpD